MIDLNDQRQAYINARGKVVLKACPGSGKTTTIAYKIHDLIENNVANGIACLSFTNVATQEIKEKYTKFSNKTLYYPHLASTIDSFINTYITLPFFYLINGRYQRPNILDDDLYLDSANIEGLWDRKTNKLIHVNKENKALVHIYKPSTIIIDINGIYSSDGNIPDASKVDGAVFQDYAKTIKKWQLKVGLLTNSDSTFLALHILKKYSHVSKSLAKRFDFIIVDEAQDTSEIQHAVFEKLMENGLNNIELVGDPYQSLYSWRGAKPRIFMDKYLDPQWQSLHLSDNWRSTQQIVNTYSILRNSEDEKIISKSSFDKDYPIYLITYDKGFELQALEKYEIICKEYKINQVVCRGLELLEKLSNSSLQQTQDYWKNPLGIKTLQAVIDFKNNDLKSSIDNFRWVIVCLKFDNLSYKARREKLKELKQEYALNAHIIKILTELSDFNISLSDWTTKASQCLVKYLKLGKPLDLQLKRGTFSPKHKKLIDQLLNNELVKWNFSISTIHKVKGMTVDSIMVFLNKKGPSISISDFVPTTGILTDNQTMLYVAMSRPRYSLAIALDNSVDINEFSKKINSKIIII